MTLLRWVAAYGAGALSVAVGIAAVLGLRAWREQHCTHIPACWTCLSAVCDVCFGPWKGSTAVLCT